MRSCMKRCHPRSSVLAVAGLLLVASAPASAGGTASAPVAPHAPDPDLAAPDPNLAAAQALLADVVARLRASDLLATRRSTAVVLLDQVARAVPRDVVLTRLSLDGPTVRIEGAIPALADRQALAAGLCAASLVIDCVWQEGPAGAMTLGARQTAPSAQPRLAPSDDATAEATLESLYPALRGAIRVLPTDPEMPRVLEQVQSLARKSGVTLVAFEPRAEVVSGPLHLRPVHISATGSYHAEAILLDRLAKMSQVNFWSALMLTPASPPAGLAASGLARLQSAALLSWPIEGAVSLEGDLVWPSYVAGDVPTSPGPSPGAMVGLMGDLPPGPAQPEDWFYNPAGLRDPFHALSVPEVASPALPLGQGAYSVRAVPLSAALGLVARSAGLALQASGLPDSVVTLAGTYSSVDAVCADLLKSTGLVATRTKKELRVGPPDQRGEAVSSKPTTGLTPQPEGPPALQAADVDGFWLVGVASGSVPAAVVVDAHNAPHIVQIGTYMGRNWGKVSAILADRIVITEEYQSIDGEIILNPVTLPLVRGE